VHRALSWLGRAEQLAREQDVDGQVIYLWIAFNSAYAADIDDRVHLSEQGAFRTFIQALLTLDANRRRLDGLVWQEFSGSIRLLLDNHYVFQDFWAFHSGAISEASWKRSFEESKAAAQKALADRNTEKVLSIVLSRIYILRNQMVHGGATWRGRVNRAQTRDAAALLAKLVPLIIAIMMDNPQKVWAPPAYPVVE